MNTDMNFFNLYDLLGSLTFSSVALNGIGSDGLRFLSSLFFSALMASGNECLAGLFLIAQSMGGKLEDALEKGLRIIALFAFIVATIVVMYGGYQIRTGNADAGKMSILGGLVIGLAVIIVTSIFEIAGLPVLRIGR